MMLKLLLISKDPVCQYCQGLDIVESDITLTMFIDDARYRSQHFE